MFADPIHGIASLRVLLVGPELADAFEHLHPQLPTLQAGEEPADGVGLPPVTRPITSPTLAGPMKAALFAAPTLNRPKLWEGLPPTWRPRSARMA